MAWPCVHWTSSRVVARGRRRVYVFVQWLVDRFVLGIDMRRFQTLQQCRHATTHDAHTRAWSHEHHHSSEDALVPTPCKLASNTVKLGIQ